MIDLILMSIQTKYAQKIFSGKKGWEFRKAVPSYSPLFSTAIVVYSAGEDKAIIGEFLIKRIVKADFENLMHITKQSGDEDALEWFKRYYKNAKTCSAIEVGKTFLYEHPLSLDKIREVYPNFRPPQNFIYLSRNPLLLHMIEDHREKI